jgi:hypothetical protein
MSSDRKEKLDFMKLPQDVVVQLLQRSGCREYSVELLQSDIEAGAPVNEDGTINLFNYGAWLLEGGV